MEINRRNVLTGGAAAAAWPLLGGQVLAQVTLRGLHSSRFWPWTKRKSNEIGLV